MHPARKSDFRSYRVLHHNTASQGPADKREAVLEEDKESLFATKKKGEQAFSSKEVEAFLLKISKICPLQGIRKNANGDGAG